MQPDNIDNLIGQARADPANPTVLRALERAAVDRSKLAAAYLGMAWSEGFGGRRDAAKAHSYFELACELGDAGSCHLAGTNFEKGTGVSRDEALAFARYLTASKLGDAFAALRLASAYSFGELGQRPNPVMAKQYFELADRLKPGRPPPD